MTDPGFMKIIHPETGGVAEVPESSQATWWRSGWVPLTEENTPPADAEPGAPEAMTADQVTAAQESAAGGSRGRKSAKTTEE